MKHEAVSFVASARERNRAHDVEVRKIQLKHKIVKFEVVRPRKKREDLKIHPPEDFY